VEYGVLFQCRNKQAVGKSGFALSAIRTNSTNDPPASCCMTVALGGIFTVDALARVLTISCGDCLFQHHRGTNHTEPLPSRFAGRSALL